MEIQNQNTENKAPDDDYDADKVELNHPLAPFEKFIEDIEKDSAKDARFVASSSSSMMTGHDIGRHRFSKETSKNKWESDTSSKRDDDHDDQLTPFREFIETFEDAKDDPSALKVIDSALPANTLSVAHFLEDAAEDDKTHQIAEEGTKRSAEDTCPETFKKRRMQEQATETEIPQPKPNDCFLCREPVKDLGLPLKRHQDIPAVLKLSCNHLVHTVCMSYLYYVCRLHKCPVCGILVLLHSDSIFYMTHYLRRSTMIQTKLLEFIQTAIFCNGEKKVINWLYKEVNGRVDIDFEKEEYADKWPILKSNEFVHEVLRQRYGYKNRFLKDLAKYCVTNHKCDEWCPEKCCYRNILSRYKFERRVCMEFKRLKYKHGERENETSTEDDSDEEDCNGLEIFPPRLFPWFAE